MKTIISGVLGLGLLLGGLLWYSSHEDQQQHDADNAMKEFQAESARVTRELDDRLIEEKARMAELRYGDAAASLYRLCHQYPPTTKEHKAKCKALDDRMARDDAKDAKHPW